MKSNKSARRRGISDASNVPRIPTDMSSRAYHTPPASRSSEPQSRTRTSEFGHDFGFGWKTSSGSSRLDDMSTNPFELYRRNETFFNRDDNESEVPLGEELRFKPGHRSQRSRDDYGVAYSFYQDRAEFSPPQTPEDDTLSLDWDSTCDPFTSRCFRRGSLVLDPAAFDSTPSVNQIQPPSPGGTSAAIKLKRSADALKEFGKKVLPKLRINNPKDHCQSDVDSAYNTYRTHRTTPSTSSQPATRSSSGRTRSNTLESSRSAWSKGSVNHTQNISQAGDLPTREQLEDSSDVLSPLATYRSTHGSMAGMSTPENHAAPVSPVPRSTSTPVASNSSLASPGLPTLLEQDTRAPAISVQCDKHFSPFGATDPGLEEIMRMMQEEDESYALTEERMVQSGWSTENEINDIRQRRQEQQNLWQRRLDDAVDQVKAQVNLD